MIFVNLPTTDLDASKAFYVALGAEINPLFTDENAAGIVWDENTIFMMLTHDHFSQFTDKPIADARNSAQMIIAMSRDSREHVDETMAAGLAPGRIRFPGAEGRESSPPAAPVPTGSSEAVPAFRGNGL